MQPKMEIKMDFVRYKLYTDEANLFLSNFFSNANLRQKRNEREEKQWQFIAAQCSVQQMR